MEQTFYTCRHCGNIIAMIHDAGVDVQCCGEKMRRLEPGTTEASGEKHIPVYTREDDIVHVTVGAVAHPMSAEHYIEWICMETAHVIQYARLKPTDKPEARFALCKGDEVRAVYAFCNKHNLWKQEKEESLCL